MRLIDKATLESFMNLYSLKEIVQELSDISLIQASKMSDLELPEAAKKWSEAAFVLQSTSKSLKS